MTLKAGDTWTPIVRANDASGAAITSLLLADWSVSVWVNGVVTAVTISAMAHLGSGLYALTLTIPATAGWHRYQFAASGSALLLPEVFSGSVEQNNLDSIAFLAVKPPQLSLSQNTSGSPAAEYTISVVEDDDITVQIPIFGDDGNLLDLSGASYEFGVQNSAQSTVAGVLPYQLTSGISGAAGIVSIVIPHTASFYGALPAGTASVSLRWSLRITLSSLQRTYRRGPLIVLRQEN